MPKIVVHFDNPDSITARLTVAPELQTQVCAYLSFLATLIKEGEIYHDEKLTDSCVILDVKKAGECTVEASWGKLNVPDLQLGMLTQFLEAQSLAGWMGLPNIQQMLNVISNLLRPSAGKAQALQRIILPGTGGFNMANLGGS